MEKANNKKILYAASNMVHINNFHLDYIKALQSEGYEVSVMARGEGADFDIPFEKKLFSPKNTAARRMVRRIIKKEGFDAIILNTSLAAFHIRFVCPMKNRPRIVNIVHGYLFSPDVNPIKRLLLLVSEIITRKKTDAIITMNEYDYRIAGKYKLTDGKIYRSRGMGAVPRPEITPPDSIREEYFKDSDFVMTFVGELSGRKNQKFLITALKIIKERIPSAILCLVGDGAEREALIKYSESLSLRESVIFPLSRRDACDFISASDLYVSASSIEGLPFNIVEAMGRGKTVLASKIKGHEDIIEHGVDGYLFELGDLSRFVDTVCRIADGELSLSEEKILSKAHLYESESVFPETLSTIKEAIR